MIQRKLFKFSCYLLFLCVLLLAPGGQTLQAQGGAGVRAGISANPDQFYFGGHVDVMPVIDNFWFRPSLEIGVGNNTTTVGFNGEFAYFFPLQRKPWSLYAGGGPAANLYSVGNSPNRNTSLKPGFNFMLGITQPRGIFAEIKVGAIDSPDFKLGIGFNFN